MTSISDAEQAEYDFYEDALVNDPWGNFVAKLDRTNIYVLDVETQYTESFDGKGLLGIALGVPNGMGLDTYYATPDEFGTIHHVLNNKDMVGFNLAFDLEILEQNGFVHEGHIWDVMVMAHLCDENEYQFSLDWLSQKYLGTTKGIIWGDSVVDIKKIEKIYGHWDDIPPLFMGTYAQQDVDLTWKLYVQLRGELEKQELQMVYLASSYYVRALQHIMQEGIVVDWDLLEEMSAEAREQMAKYEKVIGFPAAKRKQLDELLYETMGLAPPKSTKTHARSQDNEAMSLLARRYPEHKDLFAAVVRWRNWAKAESTWYEGFRKRRTAQGRIHPGLKIHGTVTGRLSCAEPNLQQMPRDKAVAKRLFVDPPGWTLIEFDYSQVELRLAGFYAWKIGQDITIYDLYKNNEDIHEATGRAVGAYEQLPTPKQARQLGKTLNFALLYGAGFPRLQVQLFKDFGFESTLDQCERWHAAYHEAYPGLRSAAKRYENYHRKKGHIELWNGRKCRIRSKVPGIEAPHHDAFNRLVQGGCGVILMQALIKLSREIKAGTIDARMCNTVHDSIWVYIPNDKLDQTTTQIIEIMETPPTNKFGVPFTVDPTPMTNTSLSWNNQWEGNDGVNSAGVQ